MWEKVAEIQLASVHYSGQVFIHRSAKTCDKDPLLCREDEKEKAITSNGFFREMDRIAGVASCCGRSMDDDDRILCVGIILWYKEPKKFGVRFYAVSHLSKTYKKSLMELGKTRYCIDAITRRIDGEPCRHYIDEEWRDRSRTRIKIGAIHEEERAKVHAMLQKTCKN